MCMCGLCVWSWSGGDGIVGGAFTFSPTMWPRLRARVAHLLCLSDNAPSFISPCTHPAPQATVLSAQFFIGWRIIKKGARSVSANRLECPLRVALLILPYSSGPKCVRAQTGRLRMYVRVIGYAAASSKSV